MQTQLDSDEVVVGVRLPRFSAKARFGFHKICRRTGEFAEAIGVVVDDPDRGVFTMVAGATGGKPIILQTSPGEHRGTMSIDTARQLLKAALFAGDEYELKLHAVALKRAHEATGV